MDNTKENFAKSEIKSNFRHITDANGKLIGGINGKSICNEHGQIVAQYSSKSKVKNVDGKTVKIARYSSTAGEYYIEDGLVYFNGVLFGMVRDTLPLSVWGPFQTVGILLVVAIFCLLMLAQPSTIAETLFQVTDSNGEWSESVSVSVLDSDIAPGSEGAYQFVIENPQDYKIEVEFSMSQYLNNVQTADFPVQFRLKIDDEPISEWCSADTLICTLTVQSKKTQTIVLEWRWPFEAGNDQNDTLLGQSGGEYYIVISLTAETTTQQ